MTNTAAIDAAMEQAIAQQITPGAVLAFGQDGQRLYCRACGHASLIPSPLPMREGTLFDLAALTKVLATTTLAMKDCETGILELDRPLRDRYVILLTNRVHPSRENIRLLDFRPQFHDLIIETMECL